MKSLAITKAPAKKEHACTRIDYDPEMVFQGLNSAMHKYPRKIVTTPSEPPHRKIGWNPWTELCCQLMHCGVWSAVWCCGDLASSGTSARSSPMRSTTGWILTSPLATMEIATTGGSCVAGARLCEHTQVIFQGSAVGHQRVTSISMEEERLSQRKIESKLLVLVMLSRTI